ncbi:glycoside hydrolase [Ceraceosorus bombacis]|uniref:Probable beta-glucosidase G n=1 Tax=Ceraceosorus bombacis TaxID=401625 RepID=A0A0P1BB54_9BASI|nr:glycoside hydrolase [Ceraceosorus bombacis]
MRLLSGAARAVAVVLGGSVFSSAPSQAVPSDDTDSALLQPASRGGIDLLGFDAVEQAPELISRRAAQLNARQLSGDNKAFPPPPTKGGIWKKGYAHAKSLVHQMTIEEVVNVTTGYSGTCVGFSGEVPRLGLKAACLQDGPIGPRPVRRVSQFPAAITTSATWDRSLFYARGEAMGRQFKAKGVDMALSPVTGGPIGRSPLSGRIFEGFGPDVYLHGAASYETVIGLQKNGLMACSKHWIAYEQETFRNQYNNTEPYSVFPKNEQSPIDSVLDDRTTHQLYMWPFAEAVRAGSAAVMCSYNEVNGSHACGNAQILNGLLKTELAFAGPVVSDWGGTWDNINSWPNGLDVTMPGSAYDGQFGYFGGSGLIDAVKNSTIPMDRVKDAAVRLLTPWFDHQGNNLTWPEVSFDVRDLTVPTKGVRKPSDADLIRRIGEESITLLKNVKSTNDSRGLPLKDPNELSSIAILGQDSSANPSGWTACLPDGGKCPTPYNNGTLPAGGGSGWANPSYVIDLYASMQHHARSAAYDVNHDNSRGSADLTNFRNQANVSEVAVVSVSAWTSEGYDRANLTLSGEGEELIKAAAEMNNNTIVVIHAPGPLLMEDWIDHPNVTAVLFAYYPGEAGGSSIPPILFGDKSPSGKLPFTIGKALEDYLPKSIVDDHVVDPVSNFTEGILGGDYAWFEHTNHTPRYPFGHGLSYANFSFSNLDVQAKHAADNTSIAPTNERWSSELGAQSESLYDQLLLLTVDITNTASKSNLGYSGPAAEVAQLYVSWPEESSDNPRALRGFEKVWLDAGESKTASFSVRRKDLSSWDTEKQEWQLSSGKYTFKVGSSSSDLRSTASYSF